MEIKKMFWTCISLIIGFVIGQGIVHLIEKTCHHASISYWLMNFFWFWLVGVAANWMHTLWYIYIFKPKCVPELRDKPYTQDMWVALIKVNALSWIVTSMIFIQFKEWKEENDPLGLKSKKITWFDPNDRKGI